MLQSSTDVANVVSALVWHYPGNIYHINIHHSSIIVRICVIEYPKLKVQCEAVLSKNFISTIL